MENLQKINLNTVCSISLETVGWVFCAWVLKQHVRM
jgi:hypothetical protein